MTSPYPLPAFYFKVMCSIAPGDTSFQEVSGIGSEMSVEEFHEGGENRFVHRLPAGVKTTPLLLKRGVAAKSSALVQWCKGVLEGGLSQAIPLASVTVFLLNENAEPACGWTFVDAYPTKWEIDVLNSTRNEVALETITLSYSHSERIL